MGDFAGAKSQSRVPPGPDNKLQFCLFENPVAVVKSSFCCVKNIILFNHHA
jgi:hypothetical protein